MQRWITAPLLPRFGLAFLATRSVGPRAADAESVARRLQKQTHPLLERVGLFRLRPADGTINARSRSERFVMPKLDSARAEIDRIDRGLVKLLAARFKAIREIADVKSADRHRPLRDFDRERLLATASVLSRIAVPLWMSSVTALKRSPQRYPTINSRTSTS